MERLLIFQGINIFRLILLVCLILFGFGCEKNPVDTEDDTYWTTPEWDGVYLSFDNSDEIEVDSVLAGKIQYRLNVARSIDESLAQIKPLLKWPPQQLTIGPTTDLCARFDTSMLSFNVKALDALLAFYPLDRAKKSCGTSYIYCHISLYFTKEYNIPVLARSFEGLEGVRYAEPNYLDYIIPPPDIDLTIDGDTYQFMFISGWYYPGNWEIHVVNDQATVISRP